MRRKIVIKVLAGLALLASLSLNLMAQGVPPYEVEALTAIYKATGGDSWTKNERWLSNSDVETWHGVSVEDGRVSEIVLPNNNLTGSLPREISTLAAMKVLDLSRNDSLTVPLTAPLISLRQMRHLRLNSVIIGTRLPSVLPNFMTRLVEFQVAATGITGPIPAEFGTLVDLETLSLGGNPGLTGPLPPELGNLENLKNLHLWSAPGLTGPIPDNFRNLKKLELLDISAAKGLSGKIPTWIGELAELKSLLVHSSGLRGPLPKELFTLTKLEGLFLGSLDLETLSDSIADLTSLRRLHLTWNHLTKLPDLTSLGLEYLNVTGNHLDFGDLERYASIDDLRYSEMRRIQWPDERQEAVRTFSYSRGIEVGGSSNRYQWYFSTGGDFAPIPDQTGLTLKIPVVAPSHAGSYLLRVMNDMLPDLELISRSFFLHTIVYPSAVQLDMSIPFQGGEEYSPSDWHLISLAGASSPSVDELVVKPAAGDDRWFAYIDNGTDGTREEYFVPYVENDDRFELAPGRGMWVSGASGVRLEANESTDSVELKDDGRFVTPLQPGWNIVGNPFGTNMSVASLRRFNPSAADEPFWEWNSVSTRFDSASVLVPGRGYYLENRTDATSLIWRYSRFIEEEPSLNGDTPDHRIDVVLETPSGHEIQRVAVVLDQGQKSVTAPPSVAGPQLSLLTDVDAGRYQRKILATVPAASMVRDLSLYVSNPDRSGYRIRLETSGDAGAIPWHLYDAEEGVFVAPGDFLPIPPLGDGQRKIRLVESAETGLEKPTATRMWPAFPNPVSTQTTIPYTLATEEPVTVDLFSMDGRRVATLDSGRKRAGRHEITFTPNDLDLANGVYIVRLRTRTVLTTTKMLVLR